MTYINKASLTFKLAFAILKGNLAMECYGINC